MRWQKVEKHVMHGQPAPRARGFAAFCRWHDDPDPPPPAFCSEHHILAIRMQVGTILHSVLVQALVTILIILDLTLAIIMEVKDEKHTRTERMVSLIVINILCFEVGVRLFVEGKRFFRRKTNIIECIVIFSGAVIAVAGSELPVSAGRIIRPLARMIRGGRVLMKLWTRSTQIKRSANQVMARKAEALFWEFFTNLVLVRPESMVFSPMTGMFDLAKARLNTEVFKEVHSPLTIKGGFLEGMHFSMPVAALAGRAALDEGDAGRFLHLEVLNFVIIISNGPEVDWTDHETLKEKKTLLVNHLVDRLVPTTLPVVEVVAGEDGSADAYKASANNTTFGIRNMLEVSRMLEPIRRWMRQYMDMIQSYITRTIQSKMMRGIDININNILIQYEEHQTAKVLDQPKWLFGLKIGQITVSTKVSEPYSVFLWSKHTGAANFAERTAVHLRNSIKGWADKDGSLGEDSDAVKGNKRGSKRRDMLKHLLISIDRISTFCTERPSVTACFSRELEELDMQAAARKANSKDLMERLRLGLARRRSENLGGSSLTPCDCKGEPIINIHRQHDYVLLPMSLEVANTLPRFAQHTHSTLTHDGNFDRSLRIETSPISVVVDNTQAHSINCMTDNLLKWTREEWLLQLRPEERIETVLHLKGSDDFHHQFARRGVVRQWWLYAFILVQESTGARSRHVACFVELQVRARRRLEYVELVAHLMRCRAHSRTMRHRLSRIKDHITGQTPPPKKEDAEYIHRVQSLQMRMSLRDVIRSHFEARFVAGKRETTVAQSKKGFWGSLYEKVSDRIHSMKAELNDEIPEKHRISIRVSRSDTPIGPVEDIQSVEYYSEISSSSSTTADEQEQPEGMMTPDDENVSEVSITLEECLPNNIIFAIPAMEFCFMLVSSWNTVTIQRGLVKEARFDPWGVRHKLFHSWAHTIDLAVRKCKLVLASDFPILMPQAIEASLVDLGASYFKMQTGEEIQAIRCGMCDMEKENKPVFAHIIAKRADDSAANPADHDWTAVLSVGHIQTLADTVKLVRIIILLGESTMGIVLTRCVRWLLADPTWRSQKLVYVFGLINQDGSANIRSNVELSEESESKRMLHIMKRIFELLMGLGLVVNFTFSCQINLSGMKCTILQPEWTVINWSKWAEQQVSSGRWHGPADKPTRSVQAEYELPNVQFAFSRTTVPPLMSIELQQVGACNTADLEDTDIDDLAQQTAASLTPSFGYQFLMPGRRELPLSNFFVQPHTMHPKPKAAQPADPQARTPPSAKTLPDTFLKALQTPVPYVPQTRV